MTDDAVDSNADPLSGAEFRDRTVYLPAADALVLADLHVGRDAASAVELPLGERADLTRRFDALIDYFAPGTVVFAGDVLHAFDRVPDGVFDTFSALRERVERADADLVTVRGNHDSMLPEFGDSPAEYRLMSDGFAEGDPAQDESAEGESEDGDSADESAGGVLVCHGHEVPEATASCYVVGHDHPAIEIEGRKRPCYLWGPDTFRGSDVLVLPAFSRFARGTVVNGMSASDFQSPLVTRANDLRPVVRDEDADETLHFPPLGKLRRLL